MAVAITVALPSRGGDNWEPFAPHGWWAVGTAANILVWLFIGWEAVAQLAGDFRRPEVDLPGLLVGIGWTEDLVRATSALFIAVYVFATLSATRILDGVTRLTALAARVLTVALAVFSAQFLVVPVVVAAAALVLRRRLR